jgi:hypothetical protein
MDHNGAADGQIKSQSTAWVRANRFEQIITDIDGLDIHFIHQRSPHPDATPLLITLAGVDRSSSFRR